MPDTSPNGREAEVAELLRGEVEGAGRRGVKKMLVNHPTFIVGCTDDDMRALVELGACREHSISMFVEGEGTPYTPQDLAHLIEVAGPEHTVLSSDRHPASHSPA